MDYNGMFDGLAKVFTAMLVLLICALPLAIWKLVEIAIWLWCNLHVSFGS